ncbi:hypothetical protein [Liquorilactobacillus satsumensis]|uniref:Uncharacterized protein n=1 Tax=Liquorilactobacillus satsumensis DSM 16230 = JCM 12392 TaxID=1423801 RepID=A0A0R1V8T2_9LACO|nr:hypothetical protein [Liquorilactobacillus satsumensis]KRM00036.1 hypothetical protein FD50_GL002275 [Liquorilactobacillus satsumensis DSM 16230 = JCM 12392]MCC7666995.1 hypothetical protein [Liquorilactobacillus satsumensis]MCP9313593.1 hypothetical protein [Liquorilactobacillus satsumensis]MCP9329707.1 hypothetical protein [Liquorilactobacillus satsumensis]MCP9358165.1 hypothetical protein [Liquorilactobacillus satsumensis]
MTYHFDENTTNGFVSKEDERLSIYCDYYSIDQGELKNSLIADYVDAHHQILDELINGYKEMGPLNKKICDEFVGCECEAGYEIENRGII